MQSSVVEVEGKHPPQPVLLCFVPASPSPPELRVSATDQPFPWLSGYCNSRSLRVHTEKSFQNSPTFHRPWQYGEEKQHKGTQHFHTSGKGAQPLLQPMADALYQSKLTGSAFSVILHSRSLLSVLAVAGHSA